MLRALEGDADRVAEGLARAAGFTWEETAERTLAELARAAGSMPESTEGVGA